MPAGQPGRRQPLAPSPKAGNSLLTPRPPPGPGLWRREVARGKARREAHDGDPLRYRDAAGRRADFHAMRHTYITRLSVADVPLTVAQRLARHSTPTLTANTYNKYLLMTVLTANWSL